LIDASVNGSTHIRKRLVKLLLQVFVITQLVEEEGSLDSGKLLGGPFAKQMVKKTF
jgi:hypothetical protein